ncbi:MAG: carboxypeptidase regulatory-like domain-containing protein [Acidobacteriia bacterium]|nr:carboxypeptidase regulatory-like domain-containing protein [Terriglobia bacterium]
MRSIRRFTLLSAFACAMTTAYAQFDAATVLGTVHDPSGSVISGSTVTLENLGTHIKAIATTDSAGNYQFSTVKIGRYRITAEASGFTMAVADSVDVTVNAHQRVDLLLQVSSAAQKVDVTAVVKLLQTDSSSRGQVINQQEIVNLPLNGRNYSDLALLAPGVRRSSIADSREGSFNVNGLRSSLNNFALDGVDNNAYATANQGFSNQVVQVSPDALAEFVVETNNFSAEFGRAGGAVVNAVMRSGSNEVHGALWEYLRNRSLNAIGFFKPIAGYQPELIQNQFGGAVGGPIVRNKMFFFADYEGYRRISNSIQFATLPTMDQRQGKLGVPVQNPYTGDMYTDGVIPASQITPFARKVLSDLPAPNLPGLANNYENLPRRTDFSDKGDVKIDHQFNERWTSLIRLSQRKNNSFIPPTIPGPSGGNSDAYVYILDQQLAGGATWTPTPSTVVELRLGISRAINEKNPYGIGGPDMQQLYGISGLPTDKRIAGGLTQQNVAGYDAWGRQTSSPQYQNPLVWDPRASMSRVAGRHSVKFGYEYQRVETEIDDFNPTYGSDGYGGQFTRPSSQKSNAIYNLADFLYGARSSYELNNVAFVHYEQRMQFAFVQDDFKVRPGLTINAGLRYEFATPQWERDNHLANFDPATQTLISAKSGSLADRALVDPNYKNFGPRIGLAYSVTPKTVIRSAYGISYIHFNRLGGENLLAYNGPYIVDAAISQIPSQGLCAANSRPVTCFRPTPDGYPSGITDPQNFSTLQTRTIYTPRHNPTPYVQAWHFTIQRQLAKDLVLDLAYVGNHSVGLEILGDANQARQNLPGQNIPLQQRRPISNFTYIQEAFDGGFSNYNALQVKLERRFSGGLYLLNSFTWSKALDDAPGHLEYANGDYSKVNIWNLASEKGLSNYNQPLNNTTTFVWDTPFGKGRRFGSSWNPAIDALLGGWRITGINTMVSGQPINMTYSPVSSATVQGNINYRPDLIGDPLMPENQRDINHYLNPNTVVLPTSLLNPFGTAARNVGRSTPMYQFDGGVHKDFHLPWEGKVVTFRSEFFNLLNKTNFQAANGNRSSTAFGTITSTFQPRQVQFALRLAF